MSLETASTINQLDANNPTGPDRLSTGDEHIRLIKSTLKNTFPNITGPMTLTQAELMALATLGTPRGVMSLWYGDALSVPVGYAVCNGQTVAISGGGGSIVTPDMRGLTAIGASAGYSVGVAYGQESYTVSTASAGAHTVSGTLTASDPSALAVTVGSTALDISQMPSHNHGTGLNDDNFGNIFSYGIKSSPLVGAKNLQHNNDPSSTQPITETVGGGLGHTHTATGSVPSHTHTFTGSGVAGHSHSVDVPTIQPSRAFHWIIKI